MSYTERVHFLWSEEDAQYIKSRSRRCLGALDIEPDWTQEVPGDEHVVDARKPYPRGTLVNRRQLPSRLFNVRLSEEHYAAVPKLARESHLPMATMARAWLLDRLDEELTAS